MAKQSNAPLERSLFDPVPNDLNEMEQRVAWYLDDQDKLLFWYRNVPKQDYAVQGWRRGKVYADFIFTDIDETGNGFNRVFVMETKGVHLEGSEDTEYKRALFDTCNELAKETTSERTRPEAARQGSLFCRRSGNRMGATIQRAFRLG